MSASNLFSGEEKSLIVKAIKKAELNTSGEIRVHIEKHCKEDVMDRAAYWFKELNMHKTELRNGVLFYLAYNDKAFAILGDGGINAKVDPNFWDGIRDTAISEFKRGNFAQGLASGIEMAGDALKEYYPYQLDDVNELDDEISFGQ